jgi:hypothetical protein
MMISLRNTQIRRVALSALLAAALFLGALPAGAQAATSETPSPLRVTPAEAVVAPGGEIRFAAQAGASTPLAWRVVPASLGVIMPDGTFLAGDHPGRGIIRVETLAAQGEDRGAAAGVGHALVRVSGSAATNRLRIRPSAAALLAGRSVLFEAVVTGPGTEGADRHPQVQWSVEPPTLGAISPDGVLTPFGDVDDAEGGGRSGLGTDDPAGSPGGGADGFVVARATLDGVPLEARAPVRLAPFVPAGIALDVKPRFITTGPGTDVQVGVFLAGHSLPADATVNWSVMPPTLGSITPDGLFSANENLETPASDEFGRREGVLIATATLANGTLASGSARVEILPVSLVAQTEVHVVPAEATIRLGQTVRFRIATSSGVDPVESIRDVGGPRVDWHVQPERAGTIGPDGVFMPNPRLALIADLESEPRFEARIIAEVRVSPSEVIRGSARILIQLPAVGGGRLAVEPNPAEVTAPAPLRFVGRLDGRDVSVLDVQVTWVLLPQTLGRISPDGTFQPNPDPPLLGEPIRRGRARLIITQGEITLEADAAVTVRY